MKKKLLFVIDSLTCGGAEKSLVTLLSLLDYDKFDVDLQLFAYGGPFEKFLHKRVNLLEPLVITDYLSKPLWLQFLNILKKENRNILKARLKYSFLLRKNKRRLNNAAIARIYWNCFSSCIKKTEDYDVAIGYGQAVPTFYVAEKASSKLKYGWVNAQYTISGVEKDFQFQFYKRLNKIVLVTPELKDIFKTVYPDFQDKMVVIQDILSDKVIKRMSLEGESLKKIKDEFILVTIGRLNQFAKGFDILLLVNSELKKRNINFKWYIIGEGPFRKDMEIFIAENNLQTNLFLLGFKSNPYSYLASADLYVQTSRHEGFGLSIAEARLLNVPVVTTEFDAVYNQMIPEENGLVVPQDPVAVADAIERLLTDKNLYQHIVSFLKTEKKGNTEELEKFYALIER